jgi:cytochrome P450
MKVIGMLLGIPEEGQAAFRDQSNAKIQTADGGKIDFSEEVILSHEAMGDYVDWRYTHPSGDVMTELINAEFEDENGVTRTHYCLGSALARLEGRVALEEILKRWPTWEVDWDGAKLQQTSSVRGWEKLPLVVG